MAKPLLGRLYPNDQGQHHLLHHSGQRTAPADVDLSRRPRRDPGRPHIGTRIVHFSTGRFETLQLDVVRPGDIDNSPRAYWAQIDAGLDMRFRVGLGLVVALGAAWMTNPGSLLCATDVGLTACSKHREVPFVIPTLSITLGIAG